MQFPISSFQFRIWLRALTVKRPQAAVTVGSLLVGAMVASTLLNLYSDVQRKMTYEFAAYGPNVVLAPPYASESGRGVASAESIHGVETSPGSAGVSPARGVASAESIYGVETSPGSAGVSPARRVASAESIYGVETSPSEWPANLMDQSILSRLEPANRNDSQSVTRLTAAPLLYVVVRVDRPGKGEADHEGQSASVGNVVAVGTDFAALRRLNPNWRVQAGTLDGGTCALGTRLAARLRVRPGDAIRLQTLERAASQTAETWQVLPISSVVATGSVEDDQVFVPLAALQKLAGLAGKISLAQLSIPGDPAEIERGMSELSRRLPGLQVRPVRQIVYSEGQVLGTLRSLLTSLTSVIVVIIGLCVMATIISIVLERRKDIAVMKALGASDRRIMQLLLSEVAALGLAGGVTGTILGLFLARDFGRRLFGVNLEVTGWTLPAVVLAAVLLALLASLIPLRVVRGIKPAAILKGE